MINLIISLIIGGAVWGLSLLVFESPWTGIWLFFPCALVAFFILNRASAKKVQAIMGNANQMLQNAQKLPNEQARNNLIDKYVAEVKKAYAYKNQVLFLEKQLDGQIGSVYYALKRFKEAEPYLKNYLGRQGEPACMYACLLYKNKDYDGMERQFEKALKMDAKKPLLWNLYAWCLMEIKKRDKAIDALNRCLKFNPGDKITQDNIDLAKNSGKIHMRPFNEQWYQFHLDENGLLEMQKMLLDKHSVVRGR